MYDINTHVGATMVASENLVRRAEEMFGHVDDFCRRLKAMLANWESEQAKAQCVPLLDSCEAKYNQLFADIRELAATVAQSAQDLQATDRRNASMWS